MSITVVKITNKDKDLVKKYLPSLIAGKSPKSKALKAVLAKVITSKWATAEDEKTKNFLWKLLVTIHPENADY